ncbi:MAG TPA: DUF4349 domain-containing protein [Conexibacter sp.]|jgi:hypothetical protein|nr:DUF4349 domain-containing protein [Conexibacter sp.]
MTPPEDRWDDPTPEEIAELGALLVAERPQPSPTFAAELDACVAARFATPRRGGADPRARAAKRPRRWQALLHRPFLPAAATALAVGLVALVVALGSGGDTQRLPTGVPALSGDAAKGTSGAVQEQAAPERAAADEAAPAPQAGSLTDAAAGRDAARKIERTASIELGTDADRVDDVAQSVLGVVARYDAIVDQSSVQSGAAGGQAQFELRIPAARLQPALAALSHLPDAHVLARTDDTVDVNQAYVSVRRRLANARAERAGVVRALANADAEDETLRLRARLDALEHTIAQAERAQRALDRRVDYSRVSVAVHSDAGGGAIPGAATDDGSFTLGDAARDALRVLEVAAGVVVIAAAALLPAALLAALAWPLAVVARRRRREHTLDTA